MYFFIKLLISASIIAIVTQLAEKMPKAGALIISLLITSLLVFFIMKYDGRSNAQIATVSWDVLYMIIPSLVLFIVLPIMLNRGMNFYLFLMISTVFTAGCYLILFKLSA